MIWPQAVVFSILVAAAWGQRWFPDGFLFGAATAAYQVEGGWNASDKGESVWDRYVHAQPEKIKNGSTGDVACDSYHLWREDIQLAVNLGLDFYRFSISWPRVLPTGFPNVISKDGSRYYGGLIDELLKAGVQPVVTLFHWDLPQSLQDLGGWTNPLSSDWFVDYVRVIFDLYGDRVKIWLTINEPNLLCEFGYGGKHAPGVKSADHIASYLCTKNVLLAHAKAYRLYEKEYKPKYHGEVSIVNQESWFEPCTSEDVEITALARDQAFGRLSHPIFSAEGGWPPSSEQLLANKSKKEGYPRSRLPAFTPEEIDLIKGSADFFALNHYTSKTIRRVREGEAKPPVAYMGLLDEIGAVSEGRPEWPNASASWLSVYPEGLRKNLRQLKQQYGEDLRILITENGYPNTKPDLHDKDRIQYLKDYLEQVLLAIHEDGVSVVGYSVWSLIDDFEWTDGYSQHFGLHAVNFSDPRRPRTPRASAHFYAKVLRTRNLDGATVYFDNEVLDWPTKEGVANHR